MATTTPVIAGYGDLTEVGRGGFAVVYRAHHAVLDRDVALKVMANANLDEASQRRFERECHAMGKLSWHPHIVPVYDAGATDEGWPYLAMAYLERGSLGDKLQRDGRFSANEALHAGVQVSGAMQAAHDSGMLHRDVKPENVLIDPLGDCRLSDFGIAALSDQSVRTDSGQLLGSVLHASPEVLSGRRATERSDVYSLASMLFELLSGAPAFYRPDDESIVAVILRATSELVPDLRDRGVPEPVAALVRRAMDKDPAARPATARQLGEDLQRAQHALGATPTPLRLPAPTEGDLRSTVPRVRAGQAPIVITDLEPPAAQPARSRVRVESQPIVVVPEVEAPPVVDVFYCTDPRQTAPPPVAEEPSRRWFWSALIASLLAVAVTTTAIVVALTSG